MTMERINVAECNRQ